MSFLAPLTSRRLPLTTTSLRRAFSTTSPRDLARLSLIGRLGSSPELTTTKTGKEIIKYIVAVNSGPLNELGIRATSWFRVSTFNVPEQDSKGREYLLGLEKGTLVFVDGDATLRTYQDAETGKTLSSLSVLSRHLEVLKRPNPVEDPTLVSE